MVRILKYVWYCLIMWICTPLPDVRPLTRLRGWLVRPSLRSCGRRFELSNRVAIVYPSRVSIGTDVYIATGCWIQGYGCVTLEDEVMMGPYTVLASNNHQRKARSFRFAPGRAAPIVMERGSWTGSHVSVMAGVRIGVGAACAAGSVVTRSVPPDTIVAGVPARPLKTVADTDLPEDEVLAETLPYPQAESAD